MSEGEVVRATIGTDWFFRVIEVLYDATMRAPPTSPSSLSQSLHIRRFRPNSGGFDICWARDFKRPCISLHLSARSWLPSVRVREFRRMSVPLLNQPVSPVGGRDDYWARLVLRSSVNVARMRHKAHFTVFIGKNCCMDVCAAL